VPFRQAHQIVGRLAAECEKEGVRLAEMPLEQFRAACDKIEQDVYDCLGPANVVAAYQSEGSAGQRSLARQLRRWQKRLS
jgi:argininosuccinate lyase